MSNAQTNNAHAHGHAHPTVELAKVSQHAHDTHDATEPYPVVQESSQYTHKNTHDNTHRNTHPHPTVQPIEVSQYTYDTSDLPATTHDQTLRQHSVASPPQPTASRIHPVETKTEHPHLQEDHKKHDKHDKQLSSQHHPDHPKHEPEHAHKLETQHAHKPEHHYSPSSSSSTIESDSVQVSPVFGNAERRQSWSKDEMKRGVIEDLLEKGKGKQAKGGYSSTS